MIIKTLSKTRGILSLYDGDKYIIWSEVYGVVAESTAIRRFDSKEFGKDEVEIDFDICEWIGYWDLKSIITRGINKAETEYVPKTVIIKYNMIKEEQNYLRRSLEMKTVKY